MPCVFVIDDEPLYHKMIANTLEPSGFQVEIAVNGTEGLRMAKSSLPDAVIIDVMMPDITGSLSPSEIKIDEDQSANNQRSRPDIIGQAEERCSEQ